MYACNSPPGGAALLRCTHAGQQSWVRRRRRREGMHTELALTSAAGVQEEAERLAARLAAFPTSATQDAALLAAEGPAALGPAAARVVHFRMLRKQALAHAIAEIRKRLGGRSGAAHGNSAWEEL